MLCHVCVDALDVSANYINHTFCLLWEIMGVFSWSWVALQVPMSITCKWNSSLRRRGNAKNGGEGVTVLLLYWEHYEYGNVHKVQEHSERGKRKAIYDLFFSVLLNILACCK